MLSLCSLTPNRRRSRTRTGLSRFPAQAAHGSGGSHCAAMKSIPLGNSKRCAFVSDADYALVSPFTWGLVTHSGIAYADATINGREVLMHRLIMPGHAMIDHWDTNGLNNCRENLRPCNGTQNQGNSRKRAGTSSRFKGVSLKKATGKWQAYIKTKSGLKMLGTFSDEVEAAKAYNHAAKEYFKEFARLNPV
jgi:hypothetical protein